MRPFFYDFVTTTEKNPLLSLTALSFTPSIRRPSAGITIDCALEPMGNGVPFPTLPIRAADWHHGHRIVGSPGRIVAIRARVRTGVFAQIESGLSCGRRHDRLFFTVMAGPWAQRVGDAHRRSR